MPRYFFIVESSGFTYDDPEGDQLPGDALAKDHAPRIVRELKDAEFESSGAVLHVRDEHGRIIHSIPFWLA